MELKEIIASIVITFVVFVVIGFIGFVFGLGFGGSNSVHVNQHDTITVVSKESRVDGEGVTHYHITYKDGSGKVVSYFKYWNNPYYVYENVEVGKTYDIEYGSELWLRNDDVNGTRYIEKIDGKDVSDHADEG
jgi:preprotein translocase subunit SecF